MNEEEVLNEIDFCLVGEYITSEHREAIEGLLSLYQQEKEKNKKLEEELNKFMSGEVFSANQAKYMEKQNKIFQKVIDMMAEELPINAEICDKLKDSKNDCYADIADEKACSNCIREYYFNKVKEKQDDK